MSGPQIDCEGLFGLMKDCVSYENGDVVFFSGSLVQGIGNEYSDIDAIVVVADPLRYAKIKCDLEDAGSRASYLELAGHNFDIEYWPQADTRAILERTRDIDLLNIEMRTAALFSSSHIEKVHRTLIGQCVHNRPAFDALRGLICVGKFFQWQVRLFSNLVDSLYDDVMGNLRSHQLETAFLTSERILLTAMKCLLLSHHISLDRDKWIFELCAKHAAEYEDLQTRLPKMEHLLLFSGPTSRSGLQAVIEERLEFSTELLSMAQLHGGEA